MQRVILSLRIIEEISQDSSWFHKYLDFKSNIIIDQEK